MAKGSQRVTWLQLGRTGNQRRCDVCGRRIKVGEIQEYRVLELESGQQIQLVRCWKCPRFKELAA